MEFTKEELVCLWNRTNLATKKFLSAYEHVPEYNESNDLIQKVWRKIADKCVEIGLSEVYYEHPKLNRIKEVTMKEVCEKFGQEVKIIKE